MICFKRNKHSLAVIRENPIPRLALHCVIGPGSYNSFIFLYLALRCFFMHRYSWEETRSVLYGVVP